ncbi:MAG TPA: CRISPR-associated endonuclease Cas1 [Thermoplasmata archaeon]|nr:CRISPR-associated endonuclease Cas1 [Thermoplasmata archaeon]
MKILFLGDHGPTNIRSTKDGLIIGDASPVPPPDFAYDTILIGNTKGFVSYAALKTLGKWGITVGLLGRSGTPLATFVPWARNDAPLRLAQMQAALDEGRRVQVARAILEAKIGQRVPRDVRAVRDLRGYESKVAQVYWNALGVNRLSGYYKTLHAKATTSVNAAINYAQGVHAVLCRRMISLVGLDPAVGFLHHATYDKDAFVYDWQELARQVVDREAIAFARETPAAFLRDEDWVYRLKNNAAKQLALQTGEALSRKISYHGERATIETVLTGELRKLGGWFRKPTGSLSLHAIPA